VSVMRVGSIEARPGTHVFGYLSVAKSRSGLSPDIPVHLFCGAKPGPTFLVQGAIHGDEIFGTIAILNFVSRLDPRKLRGNVIAVPVVNRMGFELGKRVCPIDGKDISRLFPGNAEGSVSDQIAYTYFEEVIKKANVMLDLHAGGLTGYERYVLFTAEKDPENHTELEKKCRRLVVAFGLDCAAFFPPGTFGGSGASRGKEAMDEAGVISFTVELGGGTGWFKNGEDNMRDEERGIWNIAKAMRMIDGDFEADGPFCTIYKADVVLWKPPYDGLYIRKKQFEHVKAGEVFASILDPYTGKELGHVYNTKDSTVVPGGQQWPTLGATSIVELGTPDEIVDRRTADLHVSFE